MSYAYGRKAFTPKGIVASPGDVFRWYRPPPIHKDKYHLCLSFDYDFTFLNTPSDRSHRLDREIAASDMRFLKPTATRFSSVSCTSLQDVAQVDRFRSFRPVLVGTLASDVLFRLLDYIARLGTTTGDEAERLLDTIETMSPSLHFQRQATRAGRGRL